MQHPKPRPTAATRRLRQVDVQHYRLFRMAIRDDGGNGWNIRVYAPDDGGGWELRCSVPGGLDGLLTEARSRIDRRIDGEAWQLEP